MEHDSSQGSRICSRDLRIKIANFWDGPWATLRTVWMATGGNIRTCRSVTCLQWPTGRECRATQGTRARLLLSEQQQALRPRGMEALRVSARPRAQTRSSRDPPGPPLVLRPASSAWRPPSVPASSRDPPGVLLASGGVRWQGGSGYGDLVGVCNNNNAQKKKQRRTCMCGGLSRILSPDFTAPFPQ